MLITSCGNSSNNALEGYEWLEGRWVTENMSSDYEYSCAIITKDYCQYTSHLWDGEVITDLSGQPKLPVKIELKYDPFMGDVKAVCEGRYYLDEARQQIYWVYDFDQKMYMEKN